MAKEKNTPSEFGAICNCERCGVRCRVGAIEPSKAKMLRHSTKPKGYCNNCALTEWLANAYPANMIIEESQHGPAILLIPALQEQFAKLFLKDGYSDATAAEINWQTVVDNWNLPLRVKTSATNPHGPGDSLMRGLSQMGERDPFLEPLHEQRHRDFWDRRRQSGRNDSTFSIEDLNELEPGLGDSFRRITGSVFHRSDAEEEAVN